VSIEVASHSHAIAISFGAHSMAKRLDDNAALGTTKTLSTQLADRLCDRIRNDRLTPGTRLGTEADLADEFGVSRQVVREAIGCLRGLGVVTGRQRLGLFVANGDVPAVLEKALSPQAADENGLRQLRQFRVVIELGTMPMAIGRVTSEQIDQLTSIAVEMRRVMKSFNDDPVGATLAFNQLDLQFHKTILEAAGADLASQFHHVLVKYFREDEPRMAAPTFGMVREHERIARAIAKRDSALAVQLLKQHLQPLLESTE